MAAHPTGGGEDDELLLGGVVGVHLQAEAAETCLLSMDLMSAWGYSTAESVDCTGALDKERRMHW